VEFVLKCKHLYAKSVRRNKNASAKWANVQKYTHFVVGTSKNFAAPQTSNRSCGGVKTSFRNIGGLFTWPEKWEIGNKTSL